jgi:hypothetical protein
MDTHFFFRMFKKFPHPAYSLSSAFNGFICRLWWSNSLLGDVSIDYRATLSEIGAPSRPTGAQVDNQIWSDWRSIIWMMKEGISIARVGLLELDKNKKR